MFSFHFDGFWKYVKIFFDISPGTNAFFRTVFFNPPVFRDFPALLLGAVWSVCGIDLGKIPVIITSHFLSLPSLFLRLWHSHYESVINFEFISQFLLMLLLPFFFFFLFPVWIWVRGTWRLTSRPRGTGKCVSIRLPPLTLRCVMTSTLEEHRAGVRVVVLVSVRPGGLRGQVWK